MLSLKTQKLDYLFLYIKVMHVNAYNFRINIVIKYTTLFQHCIMYAVINSAF